MSKTKTPKYTVLVRGYGEFPAKAAKGVKQIIQEFRSYKDSLGGQDFLVVNRDGNIVPLVLDPFGNYVLGDRVVAEELPLPDRDELAGAAGSFPEMVAMAKRITQAKEAGKPGTLTVERVDAQGEPYMETVSSPVEDMAAGRINAATQAVIDGRLKADDGAQQRHAPLSEELVEEEPVEMVSIEKQKLAYLYQEVRNFRNRSNILDSKVRELEAALESDSYAVDEKIAHAEAKAERAYRDKVDMSFIEFGMIPLQVLADGLHSWEQFDAPEEGPQAFKVTFLFKAEDYDADRTSPIIRALVALQKEWEARKPVAHTPGRGGW